MSFHTPVSGSKNVEDSWVLFTEACFCCYPLIRLLNVLQGDDHSTKESKVSLFKQSTDLYIFHKPPTNRAEVVEMAIYSEKPVGRHL